uniref:Uncharacterized protein n=1 Tax=Glossina austeni TaxID=7395 RepID=A0A1A9VS09_GLOAU
MPRKGPNRPVDELRPAMVEKNNCILTSNPMLSSLVTKALKITVSSLNVHKPPGAPMQSQPMCSMSSSCIRSVNPSTDDTIANLTVKYSRALDILEAFTGTSHETHVSYLAH